MVLHKLQIMWACTEEETHTLSTNGNTCSLVNAKCTSWETIQKETTVA